MSEPKAATLSPEERNLVAAYRQARAAGRPLDLNGLLAGPQPPAPARAPATLKSNPGVAAAPQVDTAAFVPTGVPAVPRLGDFDDYELLEEVARGGMGVVFRAREKRLNRVVALKMILAGGLATPEEVRRFRLEAEEASNLDHPHIVPIYHVGECAGHHYFTMKFIEGGTLNDLPRGGKADPRQAARILIDVAGAIHYAHQRGILHRDLKPGNVLIDKEGRPHVTDFGLVKHLGRATGHQTRSGAILGTPGYVSPEQASARKDLTTASDVYGLGAILYDLLTGRPPFDAVTPIDTLMKVMSEEPLPPRRLNPSVERDLETVCLKCLHKDPRQRYASAEALAGDLERYLAGEPIQARPVGVIERTRKWVRRRPVAAAVAGVLALAVLVLAVGSWVVRARLDAADRRAEQGEQEATRQRVERKQAVDRLEAVNDFLINVSERLAKPQAPQQLRLEILRDGLQLSEQFRQGVGEDPAARRQTARWNRCLGDLWQEAGDTARAQEAYGKALALLDRLAADFPEDGRYRTDLAQTLSQQARLSQAAKDYHQAEAALKRAIALLEELARQEPTERQNRQAAAEYRYTLGAYFEEQGKAAQAEAAYRAALEGQEKLAADLPNQASIHQQLAATAGTLGWLLEPTKPADAQQMLRKAQAACRQARGLQPNDRGYPQTLFAAYNDLATFFKERGLHAELPTLAEELRRDFPNDGGQTYNAACWLADAARVVSKHTELPAQERQRLEDGYAAAAVRLLGKAIKEGYTERAHMEADNDLDPLRQRQDFQQLMADLEQHAPLTPESELEALHQLPQASVQQYATAKAGARTQADRKRAEAQKADPEALVQKFLQLARHHPESKVAIDALVEVLINCDPERVGPWASAVRRQAVQMLERDHLHKPELADVCVRFTQTPVPEAEQLLQAVARRHERREVRGLAGLALATSLAQTGRKVQPTNPVKAQELLRRADEEFDRVAKEYGTVKYGRSTLAEAARYQQQEARHLGIGCVAQDIEGADLDGKTFRLSDYRGKVVVLDFWADWCGYCRQMYPQEKEMVRRLESKPFALLGVNADDDPKVARETVQRRGLNWRSWYDSGPPSNRISRDWHVNAFPNVWVLDHKGVIRFKDLRGPELDAAVNQLVAEAEGDK
jgi:thiol-disulfide isomerase/thioredoxin